MSDRVDPPMAMLAELTHRCPLACPYCSNPTELTGKEKSAMVEILKKYARAPSTEVQVEAKVEAPAEAEPKAEL